MTKIMRSTIKSVQISPTTVIFSDLVAGEYFIQSDHLDAFIAAHGTRPINFDSIHSIRSRIFMVCDEGLVVTLNGIAMDAVDSSRALTGTKHMGSQDIPLHRVQVSLDLQIN
jgi:hypothetical protein